MLTRICFLFALLLPFAPSYGDQIYKWTDENGQIHYGNKIPDSQKKVLKTFKSDPLTSGQQTSLPTLKKPQIETSKAPLEPPPPKLDDAPTTSQSSDKKSECEEAWKKYEESQACFAPYVLYKGRGVKAEAFEHCTVVHQPTEICK